MREWVSLLLALLACWGDQTIAAAGSPLSASPAEMDTSSSMRLNWETQRFGPARGPAEWRQRLGLDCGAWSLRVSGRRRDGENGTLPHRAVWVGAQLPHGWRLSSGAHQLSTEAGTVLGRSRGGLPGRLQGGLKMKPGSNSRWTPEDQGIALAREHGPTRGGLLVARTRRDISALGDRFVLDMDHSANRTDRVGAWDDGLALAWLVQEGHAGWDGHALLARRTTPTGDQRLGGLHLIRRRPRYALAFVAEKGESQVWLCQGLLRGSRRWLQLDLWRGRTGKPLFTRAALPLGQERAAGGGFLQAGLRHESAEGGLALRWLEAEAARSNRSALWYRLDLAQRLGGRRDGLHVRLRRMGAEDRPVGSGLDRWRVEAAALREKPLSWRLAWEQDRSGQRATRLWHLAGTWRWNRGKWRGAAHLHFLVGSGTGGSRLVPLSLAPGILRYAAISGQRQGWGGGLWLERGAHRLSMGLLLKEQFLDEIDPRPEQVPELFLAWRVTVR